MKKLLLTLILVFSTIQVSLAAEITDTCRTDIDRTNYTAITSTIQEVVLNIGDALHKKIINKDYDYQISYFGKVIELLDNIENNIGLLTLSKKQILGLLKQQVECKTLYIENYMDSISNNSSSTTTSTGGDINTSNDIGFSSLINQSDINNQEDTIDINDPNILFVSASGSNNNPGTYDKPFQTLEYAFSKLRNGKTLIIRDGTYYPVKSLQPSLVDSANSEEDRIVIKPYPGEKVVIDFKNLSFEGNYEWSGGIELYHRHYVTIEGLNITNVGGMYNDRNGNYTGLGMGIYLNASNNCIIRNNHISNTYESAIFLASTKDTLIEGNEADNCCIYAGQECFSLYNNKRTIVRYNYIHNVVYTGNSIGIDIKNGAEDIEIYSNHLHDILTVGIYIDARGAVSNTKIYNNYIHDSRDGMVIASETKGVNYVVDTLLIYNNVFINNQKGIVLGWALRGFNFLQNITIENNLIYENDYAVFLATTYVDDPDYYQPKNISIIDNVLYKNTKQLYKYNSSDIKIEEYTIDGNIIYAGESSDLYGTNIIEKEIPLLENSSLSIDDIPVNISDFF